MRLAVKLDGAPETAQRLRDFCPDILKRHTLDAFIKAAQDTASTAKGKIHNITGDLANSFGITVKDRGRTYSVTLAVDAKAPGGYYASWVDTGHAIGHKGKHASARIHRYYIERGLAPEDRSRMKGTLFFSSTIDALRGDYSSLFAQAVDAATAEVNGAPK